MALLAPQLFTFKNSLCLLSCTTIITTVINITLHPMSRQIRKQIRLPQLPADIIHTIVDELVVAFDNQNSDQWERHQNRLKRIFYSKELLDLRAVCREFCHIVTPRIFRTLRFTHTLPSIKGFITMLQSPWVAHCVQSVKYQYWDPGKFHVLSCPPIH